MFNSRILQIVIFALSITAIVAPFICNPRSIYDSADYYGAFWSLSASILLGYFAWVTYNHSKVLEKPILTAETVKEDKFSYYVIKNCGQVPAMNVKLFIKKDSQVNDKFDEMVLCGSIKTDEYKVISWYNGVFKIGLVYEDFSGKSYSTIVQNDYCENKNGNFLKINHRGYKGKTQVYFGEATATQTRTLFRYDDRMGEEAQKIQLSILQKLK